MAAIPSRPSRNDLAWFFCNVVRDGDCWRWVGTTTRKGYGMAFGTSAHRATYLWFAGPIPVGYHVDHLCRNRWCVNPAHGEAVTCGENVRRGCAVRTHCRNGLHPISQRLYIGTHWETCHACRLESRRRWMNKVRLARVARRVAA